MARLTCSHFLDVINGVYVASDAALKPDEDVYGVTYDEIDDFLEGRTISPSAFGKITAACHASANERALPVVPVE
jgi:NAD+ synthase